jgi:hypothetical protein
LATAALLSAIDPLRAFALVGTIAAFCGRLTGAAAFITFAALGTVHCRRI